MFDQVQDRWLGLVGALGVLLVLAVYAAVRNADDRRRRTATVFGLTTFVVATAGAIGQFGFLGLIAAYPRYANFGDNESKWLAVALGVVGLAAGLLFATGSAPVADPGEPEEPEDPETDDVDEVSMPHVTPPAWLTDPVRAALAAVVALALPLTFRSSSYLAGLGPSNGWKAASIALYGASAGGAVLFVALAARLPVPWAAAAFGLVAAGEGLTVAFPDVFDNPWWAASALGLAAGLLAPAALHMMRASSLDDRAALVTGIALALLLLTAASFAASKASLARRNSFGLPPLGQLHGDQLGDLGGVQRGALA